MVGRVAPLAPTSINVSVTHKKTFSLIIRWTARLLLFRRQIEARGPLTSTSVIVAGCVSKMKRLEGVKAATWMVYQRVDLHQAFSTKMVHSICMYRNNVHFYLLKRTGVSQFLIQAQYQWIMR